MKRCKKIIVVLIVLAMISIVVLPVFTSLSVNMGTICGLLRKIANSVIVNASDDYTYAGNVVFNLNASNELYVYCSDYLCNRVVKCSINNSEFQDFLIGSDTVPTENDVTSIINDIIRDAFMETPPASFKGKKLKVYFAHQSGTKPPRFDIEVNSKGLVHFSYYRYLENKIRENIDLSGTPIIIQFKNKGEREL